MRIAILAIGVVLLVAGAVVAVWANGASITAASQFLSCTTGGGTFECLQYSAQAAQYSLYFGLGLLLAVIGIVLAIVGAILSATKEAPLAAVPATIATPGTASAAPVAPCVRCGRPARWIAQNQRWFCDAEQMYV